MSNYFLSDFWNAAQQANFHFLNKAINPLDAAEY